MNSVKRFKTVVIAIILGLSSLLIFDIYYLCNLYSSIKADTVSQMYRCIENADNRELQERMEELSRRPDLNGSISVSKSISNSKPNHRSINTEVKQVLGSSSTKELRREAPTVKKEFLISFEKEMRSAIHQGIDPILPQKIKRLKHIIDSCFASSRIDAYVVRLDVVHSGSNQIVSSSVFDKSAKGALLPIWEYDKDKRLSYRVFTSSINGTVISGMLGILISTFLMILFLVLAFWYLIRTVMQLKTLEEMKTDFINNMTHELKTPIAVAYSAVDTLLNFKQGEDKVKREKYLQICIDQLTRLNHLVGRILSLSAEHRSDIPLNKEPILVKELAEMLVERHKLKHGSNIQVTVDVSPADFTIVADLVNFENVISNLIDNAIKYSTDDPQIRIVAYSADGMAVVEVTDSGMGISKDNLPLIFERFYRVPNGNLHDVKGNGLGLYYAKSVVEKHGGSISASSKLGKGSTFKILIPIE